MLQALDDFASSNTDKRIAVEEFYTKVCDPIRELKKKDEINMYFPLACINVPTHFILQNYNIYKKKNHFIY